MKTVLFISILLCGFQGFTQQLSTFGDEEKLRIFVSSQFVEVSTTSEMNNVGLTGVCYVRFAVTDGKLQDVHISPTAPEPLRVFLERTMGAYRKKYSSTLRDTSYREFVLPVEYTLQKGGNTTDASTTPGELEKLKKPSSRANGEVTLLSKIELFSPFDMGGNSWKKLKFIKNNPGNL